VCDERTSCVWSDAGCVSSAAPAIIAPGGAIGASQVVARPREPLSRYPKSINGSRAITASPVSTGSIAAPASARLARSLYAQATSPPPFWGPSGPNDPDPVCGAQKTKSDAEDERVIKHGASDSAMKRSLDVLYESSSDEAHRE
jgi:hypothetical protein